MSPRAAPSLAASPPPPLSWLCRHVGAGAAAVGVWRRRRRTCSGFLLGAASVPPRAAAWHRCRRCAAAERWRRTAAATHASGGGAPAAPPSGHPGVAAPIWRAGCPARPAVPPHSGSGRACRAGAKGPGHEGLWPRAQTASCTLCGTSTAHQLGLMLPPGCPSPGLAGPPPNMLQLALGALASGCTPSWWCQVKAAAGAQAALEIDAHATRS